MSDKLFYCAILLCGIILIRLRYMDFESIRYNDYLRRFNKSYSEEEFKRRLGYFKQSLKERDRLNSLNTGAIHGLTKFSDWSQDEFAGFLLSQPEFNALPNDNRACRDRPVVKVTNKYDWRDRDGVIGPVRNQKLCNGCWSFGIIGVMEAMAAINNISHDRLSIQELLDCSSQPDGCDGGNVFTALEWLRFSKFKITTEDRYPLKLVNENCTSHPDEGRGIADDNRCVHLSDDAIKQRLHHGPVMAVVVPNIWPSYNSGIIRQHCADRPPPENTMVHVVQIVGYNIETDDMTDEDVPYFIIKNSWGTDWGEDGYIRVAMGSNLCGINNEIYDLDVF